MTKPGVFSIAHFFVTFTWHGEKCSNVTTNVWLLRMLKPEGVWHPHSPYQAVPEVHNHMFQNPSLSGKLDKHQEFYIYDSCWYIFFIVPQVYARWMGCWRGLANTFLSASSFPSPASKARLRNSIWDHMDNEVRSPTPRLSWNCTSYGTQNQGTKEEHLRLICI